MVHTVWKKRAIAAVMSVAMLGTSMAATPIVWAAGNEISVHWKLQFQTQVTQALRRTRMRAPIPV